VASPIGEESRNVEPLAMLVHPQGFEMFDAFPAPEALKDLRFFRASFRGNNDGDRLANRFPQLSWWRINGRAHVKRREFCWPRPDRRS
jgi:hypothetical protein